MYTGNLVSPPTKDGALTRVVIEYRSDSGADTITDRLGVDIFTVEWLKTVVRNKLAALNATPEAVSTGPIDTTVVPPVVDAAKQSWLADDAQYWSLKRYVDDGLITQAKYPALWTTWQNLVSRRTANFKPAYLS